MNTGVTFRAIDHLELPGAAKIHALQQAAYTEEAKLIGAVDFPPLARTVAHVQSSSEYFVGCFFGEELIGVAGIEMSGYAQPSVSSLVVLPAWHRRGFGRALLQHVLAPYSKAAVQVQTAARNCPALGLYAEAGFVEIRRWFVGEPSLELVRLERPSLPSDNVA